ncbi:MAG TPA: preprotein translocase subunit YajC [Actinomycetota bacterium]|nr:preprotein translocase subunit YajC [Actinomycetota bacterium]
MITTFTVLAQAAQRQPQRSPLIQLLPLLGMVVIFYFLLIRPQQRRARQQRELVQSLEVGDQVVTIGGMHGTIRELNDEDVTLEVSPGTSVRFVRQAIARKFVLEDEEAGEGS